MNVPTTGESVDNVSSGENTNKSTYSEAHKKHHQKHRETNLLKMKEYYQKNKETIKAKRRANYALKKANKSINLTMNGSVLTVN